MSDRDAPDFIEFLGCRDLGMIDGAYTLSLDLDDRHMSVAERAHGGVLFSLLDTTLGRAVIEGLPEGQGCATVEIKINYFRPVQAGRITARGEVKQKTRRLAYGEGEIRDDAERVLARASGTFFLTETLRQKERERL